MAATDGMQDSVGFPAHRQAVSVLMTAGRAYGRRIANRISMFLLGATLALGFTMAAYLLSGAIRSLPRPSTRRSRRW